MKLLGLKTFKRTLLYLKSSFFSLVTGNPLLCVVVLFGLILRLYKARSKDLWYDEVLDVIQSQKSVSQIFSDVKLTPLHYLFVHFFNIFSSNILFLRIPSIIFGLLSIVVLYAVVQKLSTKSVALFACFLLAISPMDIEFSQQILHYSSFVFFTLLSLYFYIDLLLEKKFSLKTIFLFIVFTICNLASHISAFIIIAVQGLFFFLYYAFFAKEFLRKLRELVQTKLGLLFVVLVACSFLFILVKSDYIKIMHAFTTFDVHRPIKLGYSLTNQLHSEYITFPTFAFFGALFSWFGLGSGFRLYFYSLFFILGLLALIRKPRVLAFTVFWIFMPILILFVAKIDHWFEEKYLIFILPMYVFVIGQGVIQTINFFKPVKKILFCGLLLLFMLLAYTPIKTRTTYGFSDEHVAGYSWKQLFSQLPQSPNTAFFTLDDLYPQVYLGEKGRDKNWYTDAYLGSSTPQIYNSLTTDSRDFYYASIPDLVNLRVGNIVKQEKIGVFGNINLYKIKFLKTSPISFEGFFADTFIKLDYLKNASNWNNVKISFQDFILYKNKFEHEYQPLFLVPTSNDNSFITYTFKPTTRSQNLFLKLGYILKNPDDGLQITVSSPTKKQVLSQFLNREQTAEYTEDTYDLSQFKNSSDLEITFRFSPSNLQDKQFTMGLKYFSLYSQPPDGTTLLKDDQSYRYNSKLEGDQTTLWLKDSIQNYGWWQTVNGALYKSVNLEKPLMYKYHLPKSVSSAKLSIDTFTLDNGFVISLSNDGKKFDTQAVIEDEKKYLPHEYNLDKKFLENRDILYVKVEAKKPNPQAILRNIKLEIQ